MSSQSFNATPNTVNPAAVQGLFPNWLANPIGSQYAAMYGYDTTLHLGRVIHNEITKSIPAQYGILKILFDKKTEYRDSDEHTWTEKLWSRPLLRVQVGAGAGNPITVTLTAGGTGEVEPNQIVVLPNNTHARVTAKNTALNTITLASYNGMGNLPAIAANDVLIVEGTPIADGMNFFNGYTRARTIQYTNYIAIGQRNKRWTTLTALKYKNTNTTNYFDIDMEELRELAMQDMLAMFINGQKGEIDIVAQADAALTGGSYKAKMNWGMFPFMQQNGAMHSISSPATLEADFKELAFNSNYKNVGVPRVILGTDRALNALSTIWKDPVRYAPNDTISSLDLMQYSIGTMKFIPIVVPHFEVNAAMFPAAFANRLIVADLDSIIPTCIKGVEPISIGNTSSQLVQNGGYNDFVDFWIRYHIGMEFRTVAGSFWIDLINI
jgi:hypothetical protein